MKNYFLSLLCGLALILSSCSISKREHLEGYYLEKKWHKSSLSKAKLSDTYPVQEFAASTEKHLNLESNLPLLNQTCDTLVLTSGLEIAVEIIDTDDNIKYIRCNADSKSLIESVNRDQVREIKYSNGKKRIFNEPISQEEKQTENAPRSDSEKKKEYEKTTSSKEYVKPQDNIHKMAFMSLAVGLGGLSSYLYAFVAGPLAIIFGLIALSQIKEGNESVLSRKLAIAGIICGSISLVLFSSFIYLLILAF